MKRFLSALSGLLFATQVAFGGAVTAPTGPLEPSQLQAIINQVVANVNAGVNGLLSTFINDSLMPVGTAQFALYVYTLPANTLSANGQAIRITCFGDTAANANTKTVFFTVGSPSPTVVLTISAGLWQNNAANNNAWRGSVTFIRTGATSASIYGDWVLGPNSTGLNPFNTGSISGYVLSNASLAFASDMAFSCNGLDGTSSAGDIRGRGMIVEQVK